VVAALLQIDVEKGRRLWLLNSERNRSRDLLVAVERKEERKYRGATAEGESLLVVDWAPIKGLLF
jgi:hypothetical protein